MKRTMNFALLLCLLIPLGCATATAPTPPLAPGYLNLSDQQIGQILSGARTFYNTVQCETQTLNWSQAAQKCVADPTITKPMVLSVAEKAAFKDFMASLNAAETIHLAYHAGTATLMAAQTATNTVQQKQSALPALAVTK
jgi:hypothetical protein